MTQESLRNKQGFVQDALNSALAAGIVDAFDKNVSKLLATASAQVEGIIDEIGKIMLKRNEAG